MGRPLWGRGAADEDRRLARGYSFQIKRISPRASQERFPGGFRISPRDPLETTKGEACGPLLWKPLGGVDGGTGVTGDVGTRDGGPGRGAWGHSGVFALWGRGWGGRGSFGAGIRRARALQGTGAARRGRRALRVGAEGPINHPGQPAHSEALAAAGARDGVGIGAETIKKGGLPPRVPGERLAKRGRLRAPPAAEKASKKEWQRSKFCER